MYHKTKVSPGNRDFFGEIRKIRHWPCNVRQWKYIYERKLFTGALHCYNQLLF